MTDSNIFYAINPANNQTIDNPFSNATESEIDLAVKSATTAFEVYRKKTKDEIADFLENVANEILELGNVLIATCHQETALPIARLEGERGRTMAQLKLFASVVRDGSWVDARIDKAQPERTPLPKSDIRQMLIPIGPVAIFGASNFPLAFSVAGGDTASALAAGCPVVVKAHPAHPQTSALIASAISKAILKTGMPEAVFHLIQGNTNRVGELLVQHPLIKAVGFTGSFSGGKALFDLANARPEPIPVFAEMGSTNPVFILPEILKQKAEAIGQGLANSVTMGVGQFCTNPGISIVQKSTEAEVFQNGLVTSINNAMAGTMLTQDISKTYQRNIDAITSAGVKSIAKGQDSENPNIGVPTVFKTTASDFLANEVLAEENFGPSNIVVEANSKEEILEIAKKLKGHLTATIHGTETDFENYKSLFDILETKVGRILINGYPTGVEVCHAMVHGGPFPATTAPQTTSVGTAAIKRFVRPICYQDYPNALLPLALQNENPNQIWRLVEGQLSQENW